MSLPRRAAAGFTLIEIMVVVVIIGIIATFAVLSIGSRALDDRMDNEAHRLEQLLRLASEEATFKGLELGVEIRQDSYGFMALGPDGKWLPVAGDDTFRERKLAEPFFLALEVEGRRVKIPLDAADAEAKTRPDEDRKPQIMLLSSGEQTSFAVDLRAPNHAGYYRLEGDALGRLKLEPRNAS